ncbi:MAG: hypothetical protein JNM17_21895, partial [Archangium sp.]|nr:hypothetical protein [Archangium sp.]
TQLNEPARPIDPSVWEQLARLLANTRPNPNARRNDAPSFFDRMFGPRTMQPTTPEKQKSYLDDLRRRFSEGDLAEALRRAIPLGGTGNATLGNFVPPRRDSLQLLTPNASGGPTMIMPDSEYEQMRKLYREAADKLIAEGRIEEAAYLLAKLLHDAAGGVALLEKHGKIELAAHLAAAQNLPELERIRLWVLAGKPEEAIKLVRGNRDFAGLVNGLQTRAPDVARQLRAVWGDYLASRDRYTEAIVATAPLAEPPKAFPQWVDRALETGGVNAATALAIDLGRYPEHADDARRRVDELLANDENSSLTNTTASLLVTHAPKAPGPMYRDLWRRLMTGASRQHRSVERSVAEQVLARTGDAALQADAVPTPTLPAAVERPPLELAAPVVSGLQVFDVAELPKNRRVLAEGAAGLRIVNKDGTTIRQHLVKADALVAGPIGTQVLVISRDGHLTRVWKLHPRSLELTSWFQAQLDCFARRFDGLVWPVGMENALVLLDPATPAPMEWWRVSATHVREVELSGNAPFVVALAKDIGTNQTFRFVFDVGGQRLERRLGPETEASWVGTALASWEVRVAENGVTTLMLVEPKIQLALGPGRRAFLPTKTGLITSRVAGAWCDITHVEWKTGRMRQLARLSRVTQPVLRELTNGLVVCDEFGRVTEL